LAVITGPVVEALGFSKDELQTMDQGKWFLFNIIKVEKES
jgi:hypothetical protein